MTEYELIKRYKGGQGQADTSKFKQLIFKFLNRIFIMNTFKLDNGLGRQLGTMGHLQGTHGHYDRSSLLDKRR